MFLGQGNIIKNNLAIAWFVLICGIAIYLWLTSGWFHMETFGASEQVKSRGVLAFFDWQIFDPHPARLRPLSDMTEVIDAILRPKTFWLFGYHPSLTLSGILMALSCPILFYKSLRSMGLDRNEAMIFTALFISTIGFLSCFVFYFRPAKRLVLLALCALFFLASHYHANKNKNWPFIPICIVLMLSFFSDEAGFVYWLLVPLFIIPKRRLTLGKIIIYCMIPCLYLILAKIVLPPVYAFWGQYGPRSGVIPASLISHLLSNFFSISFYKIILEDLGRSISASFGLLSIGFLATVFVVTIVSIYALIKKNWAVVTFALSLLITSAFLSMIDMVNHGVNRMAQWTYYYHSPIAILSVLWLASVYSWLRPSSIKFKAILLCGIATISILNFVNFYRTNEIMKILHTYPLAQLHPRVFDKQKLADRFEKLISSLPQADGLHSQFTYYRDHPMGTEEYARLLERTYTK